MSLQQFVRVLTVFLFTLCASTVLLFASTIPNDDGLVVTNVGEKQVRFPDKLVGPAPTTGAVLTPDINYIVESEVDGIILARPIGLVKITKEQGPLRIRGKFIDGGNQVETRTYKGPNIFIVDVITSGVVDLSFIPFGFKTESDIISRTVVVDNGLSPRPPPDNDPTPKPNPPTPIAKVDKLWVIIVEETSLRTPDIARVLNDFVYWTDLRAKGHKVMIYDKDQEEAKANGYVRRSESVGLPCVILYDQKTHAYLKTFKLPKTTTEVTKELSEVLR